MKDILLFDLDGTLFNTKEGIVNCVKYALEYYGIHEEKEENLERFIGPPLHKSFEMFYGFDNKKAAEAAEKYRERYKDSGIFQCSPYGGMENMLKALKENGKRLGVATSKPEVFAERILEKYNLKKYFEYVTGSLLDNTRTGKSDVILEALQRFQAYKNRENVIMIGDREHDIIGAKETGLMSVGVRYGFSKGDELERAGADYVVSNVEELSALLLHM